MFCRVEENVRLEKELTSLVLCGDPGCDGYNTSAVLVLEHILRLPADLQLVLGDLVPTGQPAWFKQFLDLVNRNASAPVYALAGNHDNPGYAEFCGRSDYYILAPNLLFIVLDNSRRYFTDATIEFLRRTLAQENAPHICVAFHIPPPNPFIPNNVAPEEWQKVSDALAPYRDRVRYVFCGHVHSAFDYKLDGFRVIVTGGGGARLDPVDNLCLSDNGHHAFRMSFENGEWKVCVLDIDHDRAAQVYSNTAADRQVLDELAASFSGEAQAYRKYQLFAEIAATEGYAHIAKLFRAASESEFHHSRNMFIASDQKRSTRANLEAAVDRERDEVEQIYPRFLQTAQSMSSLRATNAYECAHIAEKTHLRLFGEAIAALQKGEDLAARKYFTCTRCGFTHAGDHPPALCPACGTDRFKFTEVV